MAIPDIPIELSVCIIAMKLSSESGATSSLLLTSINIGESEDGGDSECESLSGNFIFSLTRPLFKSHSCLVCRENNIAN